MRANSNHVRLAVFIGSLLLAAWFVLTGSHESKPEGDQSVSSRPSATPTLTALEVAPGKRPPPGVADDDSLTITVRDDKSTMPVSTAIAFAPQASATGTTAPTILKKATVDGIIKLDSPPEKLVVWAPGYGPRLVLVEAKTRSQHELACNLDKLSHLDGVVVLADNSPVAGAVVAFVPRGPKCDGWDRQLLPGLDARWSNEWTEVGFRVLTDSRGHFQIAIPETVSTLRIGTEDRVWVPANGSETAGDTAPADKRYRLRAVIRATIVAVDAVSGAEIVEAALETTTTSDPIRQSPIRDLKQSKKCYPVASSGRPSRSELSHSDTSLVRIRLRWRVFRPFTPRERR